MRREAVRKLEHRLSPPFDLPPMVELDEEGYHYNNEVIDEAGIERLVAGLDIKPGMPDLFEIDLREHAENADE